MSDLERLPPHNEDAEIAVLGSILLDAGAIDVAAAVLQPADFWRGKHERVFRAALTLRERSQVIDYLTLSAELERQGVLDELGGVAFLGTLSAAVPTAVHCEHYAQIVAELAERRRLVSAAGQIAAVGWDESTSAAAAVAKAEALLQRVRRRAGVGRLVTLSEALHDWGDQLLKLATTRGLAGLPTGLRDLDRLLHGLNGGELIIVAGRPGHGKTALALHLVRQAAGRQRVPTLLFSLEMSISDLVGRLVAAESAIDSHKLRTGQLDDDDWARVTLAQGRLADLPLWLHDAATLTVGEVRSSARRLHVDLPADTPLGLIVVDYLQLLSGDGRRETRALEVAEQSRALKALALELKVPVVVLSQLNRAIEGRPNREPKLSDLRESGGIEADADVVLFTQAEEEQGSRTGRLTLTVGKNRNGRVGVVPLHFDGATQRFHGVDGGVAW